MNKKINEIAGFCEQILKVVRKFNREKEIVFLECSCGKSYLSFVLSYLFEKESEIRPSFIGVDTNGELIQRCEKTRDILGYDNMVFKQGRTTDFSSERKIDVVIALHACNTATDEAIAKGIEIGAKYIMVVPCCQGQLRSQIKENHPLTSVTQFGLLRSKFADILTDALRSQFLLGNGYYVELLEIVPPKLTPKNILISARKIRNTNKRNLEGYNKLNNMFNTNFSLQEYFCEQPLNDDKVCAC
ncbi:MAG: SAM-dependent methyltransferase [Candidatus Scalindua sp.]|jgi:protein-L-isoaspartate O-methyltransferase|nr:SAM-dependent methyltransferase [Candidatus Scalindua sp.]MBT5304418.1 SAM-dependent methyltransferase [Candidatus Scalindua sp.]MBT6050981.1 SAM-dependent methyltransferase [Candidatus Scalindua sp.]MBT6225408.1 SAM-dependent methyltransferase [Candidatus Scalindua sp.]MBT6561370.1 SAM-dependent methyltransferase [Candidatus Scalindua sp.]